MLTLLTTLHVLIAVILILIVLVQSARGTDVAAAFGGGMGGSTAFGPRGTATVLSKATTVLAILFMLTSISLSVLSNRAKGGGESILGGQQETQQTVPAPAGGGIELEGLPAGMGVQTEITPVSPPASNPNEAQTGSPAQTGTTPTEAPSQ